MKWRSSMEKSKLKIFFTYLIISTFLSNPLLACIDKTCEHEKSDESNKKLTWLCSKKGHIESNQWVALKKEHQDLKRTLYTIIEQYNLTDSSNIHLNQYLNKKNSKVNYPNKVIASLSFIGKTQNNQESIVTIPLGINVEDNKRIFVSSIRDIEDYKILEEAIKTKENLQISCKDATHMFFPNPHDRANIIAKMMEDSENSFQKHLSTYSKIAFDQHEMLHENLKEFQTHQENIKEKFRQFVQEDIVSSLIKISQKSKKLSKIKKHIENYESYHNKNHNDKKENKKDNSSNPSIEEKFNALISIHNSPIENLQNLTRIHQEKILTLISPINIGSDFESNLKEIKNAAQKLIHALSIPKNIEELEEKNKTLTQQRHALDQEQLKISPKATDNNSEELEPILRNQDSVKEKNKSFKDKKPDISMINKNKIKVYDKKIKHFEEKILILKEIEEIISKNNSNYNKEDQINNYLHLMSSINSTINVIEKKLEHKHTIQISNEKEISYTAQQIFNYEGVSFCHSEQALSQHLESKIDKYKNIIQTHTEQFEKIENIVLNVHTQRSMCKICAATFARLIDHTYKGHYSLYKELNASLGRFSDTNWSLSALVSYTMDYDPSDDANLLTKEKNEKNLPVRNLMTSISAANSEESTKLKKDALIQFKLEE